MIHTTYTIIAAMTIAAGTMYFLFLASHHINFSFCFVFTSVPS